MLTLDQSKKDVAVVSEKQVPERENFASRSMQHDSPPDSTTQAPGLLLRSPSVRDLLQMQRTMGNRATTQFLSRTPLQGAGQPKNAGGSPPQQTTKVIPFTVRITERLSPGALLKEAQKQFKRQYPHIPESSTVWRWDDPQQVKVTDDHVKSKSFVINVEVINQRQNQESGEEKGDLSRGTSNEKILMALKLADTTLLGEMGEAAKAAFSDPSFIMTLVVMIGGYIALWLAPEPTGITKVLAAGVTVGLLAQFGWEKIRDFARAWDDLSDACSKAKTEDELKQAGEKFLKAIGPIGFDIAVEIVTAVGGKLTKVGIERVRPRATEHANGQPRTEQGRQDTGGNSSERGMQADQAPAGQANSGRDVGTGSNALSDLIEKYGENAHQIMEKIPNRQDAIDTLQMFDTIADIPGADRLMKNLISREDRIRQGALSELGYAASLRQRGFEIEELASVQGKPSKQTVDIIIKDGPVIDVKDYNWRAPFYKNPANVQKVTDEFVTQAMKHQERYPGRKIEYAFTDLENVPKEIVEALKKIGVNVKPVTWSGK